MPEIEIEENIPLPSRYVNSTRGRPAKWPFAKMKVGQSICIKDYVEYEQAKNALPYWARKLGFTFTCARSKDTNGGRIWRVK